MSLSRARPVKWDIELPTSLRRVLPNGGCACAKSDDSRVHSTCLTSPFVALLAELLAGLAHNWTSEALRFLPDIVSGAARKGGERNESRAWEELPLEELAEISASGTSWIVVIGPDLPLCSGEARLLADALELDATENVRAGTASDTEDSVKDEGASERGEEAADEVSDAATR